MYMIKKKNTSKHQQNRKKSKQDEDDVEKKIHIRTIYARNLTIASKDRRRVALVVKEEALGFASDLIED